MKAVIVSSPGDLTKLEVIEKDLDAPQSKEFQIKVSYSGINFMDIGTRNGQNAGSFPLTPGVEGSGVIISKGPEASQFVIGDRVAWVFAWGSYASHINIHEDSLVKIPDGISDETAAAVMMQGITASHFSTQFYETKPGDVALVNAAAGGVGLILTQIIKLKGGKVIGRVSDKEKIATVLAAGADHVFVAKNSFADKVLELNQGRGVDVVFDGSGPETFESSVHSLKPGGTFCWYGPILGGKGSIDLTSLSNGIKIGYAVFFHHIPTPLALREVSSQLFSWILDKKIKLKIFKTYPIEKIQDAHRDIESRSTEGKLLIKH